MRDNSFKAFVMSDMLINDIDGPVRDRRDGPFANQARDTYDATRIIYLVI